MSVTSAINTLLDYYIHTYTITHACASSLYIKLKEHLAYGQSFQAASEGWPAQCIQYTSTLQSLYVACNACMMQCKVSFLQCMYTSHNVCMHPARYVCMYVPEAIYKASFKNLRRVPSMAI